MNPMLIPVKFTPRLVLLLASLVILPGSAPRGQAADSPGPGGFVQALRVPAGLTVATNARLVTVAIVDDGVRLTHEALRPFLWRNPREIPSNRVDDDGNGHVDDLQGWDVADNDDDVSLPAGREEMFYHGTHLAGIVVQMARQAYGAEASKWLRILPVKCLEDDADKPYLKEGYDGIQYAVDVGADVILTAWGEAYPSPGKLRALQSAQGRGIIVVASAGNFPEEREQFPAAFAPALAVTSMNTNGAKIQKANYGGFVDLVAPGWEVLSAASTSDTGQIARGGTSMASAMVAGAVAILKLQRPELSNDELVACLKNTAEPVERFQTGDLFYGGKLGAGRLDVAAALAYPLRNEPVQPSSERHSHQGYLPAYRPAQGLAVWRLRPEGEIKGFWFDLKWHTGEPGKTRLKFFQEGPLSGEPFLNLRLSDWKERLFVPGRQAMVLLEPEPAHSDFKFLVEYATQPIDQSTLYCRDTTLVRTEGIIEDGSGPEDYSPRSSCKWQITAPAGKVIHVQFLEFDTEARTDWVYLFNGTGTHEKIMAVFSGPDLPPALTSWSHQALLWFVTNNQQQGKGWKAQVTFQDPPAIPPATPAEVNTDP